MEVNSLNSHIINKIDNNTHLKESPHITQQGRWVKNKECYWTDGFWIGTLWLLYLMTQNDKYKRTAYLLTKNLKGRITEENFDLGHLFYPSFVLGYKVTGDNYFRRIALEAASNLKKQFNDQAGFLCNEVNLDNEKFGRTIIDVMMNLPLLWWAYEETSDEDVMEIGCTHSKRTIELLFRNDFSTIHGIEFDLKTGELLREVSLQGYSNNSCWSRGQAWAIYGFALAYEATGESLFLETSENLAKYFTSNLPEDCVPYWDFKVPKPAVKDSSAASIACSGLITISEVSEKESFRDVALKILNSLCSNYLAGEDKDGILDHGCFHLPAGIGVDECLIWGDYFFLEALSKLQE